MGSYILGGALQGLGQGVNSAVDLYHRQALEKIKQAAEDKKNAADQAIRLANVGYRPASSSDVAAANAPTPPKLSMLDPASRAGLSQSGVATDNGDGSLTVPDGRPTLDQFGGASYLYDPDRLIGLKGGIAEAQYAPKATAQMNVVNRKGDISQTIAGQRFATQRDIATGHDATRVQTTGMNNVQSAANSIRGSDTQRYIHDNPVESYTPVQTVDDNGNATVSKIGKHSGVVTPTGANGRPTRGVAGGAGGAGNQDLEGARALVAKADADMSAFEDKVKSGTASLDGHSMFLAREVLHGSPLKATAAETLLNSINPDLASYIRSAKQFATGQRMIMPKGGSNMLAQAEAMLSAAGADANTDQIDAARGYRHASMAGKLHSATQPSNGGSTHHAAPTEQQVHYDAAAAALQAQGIDPVSKLGPRP